ncbi:uncharacterized protein LOC129573372 [Sitodiplosis mosellana]|uniref:uncharacterized protein LOC129573372 n=1 Tax=Sitodiplosis mosellana TaxID=263140 RepID=UPI002445190F|nr:uncharacterized protein LOC129573372 [Sitodiplosis mosellana]
MSSRRPRVKAAAILKPRRPQTSANEPNDIVKSETNAEQTIEVYSRRRDDIDETQSTSLRSSAEVPAVPPDPTVAVIQTSNQSESKPDIKSISISAVNSPKHSVIQDAVDSVENKPPDVVASPSKAVPKPSNASVVPTPFRRISTPPVNIVNRRKSLIATNENRPGYSPKYMKSPSYSFVRDIPSKDTKSVIQSPHHSKPATNADDDVFSPAPTENDECFKSPPFMSPIYTRRIEPSMSPFHDIYGEDYTKSPSAAMPNNKIRQRIRPTPCFASRRNSIQGSGIGGASESEDEQHRRQRHYSTSSNHSSYNPSSTPQHQRNYFGLNKVPSRVRTESYSSSISDIPFSKSKRSHRSEEYQRVANAKREFNQRLNGKPPDKSRLTMYDLIYYNPLTNPMSKPAGKGDKNSDTASVSSAKTSQSRSSGSVKSEASGPVKTVKSETTDAVTGPVPQLKLDANGEIILDEKSLVIETTGDKEAREMLANSDVIYDDEFSGTSGFYKRQKRTRDWLPLETLKFYRSLQTIGTDFSVMLQLFPNRSRRDLKLKFKKEEKHNMALINKALLHPKEFNVDELKLQFDKEDEEIEQKKQEWAEVRKKMANERREQINASRKRNPNRQVSRSMRNLTDGDIVYENEFVALPPKARRSNRKRNVTADILDAPADAMLSPLSLNHNNNHVDSLPQHTYATHKLPNFIEIMSTQKSRQSSHSSNPVPTADTSPSHINHIDTAPSPVAIETNGIYEADEQSQHAMDLSTTSLIIHGGNSNHEADTTPAPTDANESTIGQYIAKNPNLTFKGSGDIMNMDIIFENVSIEEDDTIGTTVSSESNVETTVDESAPIVTTITESEPENLVKIDGIQYEIITVANEKQCDDDRTSDDDETTVKVMTDATETVEEVDTIPVISQGYEDENYVYTSSPNEMVIMTCSNLDVAAEIEAVDLSSSAINLESSGAIDVSESSAVIHLSEPVATIDLPESKAYHATAAETETEIEAVESKVTAGEASYVKTEALAVKEEIIEPAATVQPTDTERKRKRKVVPVLTYAKRSRRGAAKAMETKSKDVPSEIQSDSRVENQTEPSMPTPPTPSSPPPPTEQIEPSSMDQTSSLDNKSDEQNPKEEQIITNEDSQSNDNDYDNGNQDRNFMDSLVVVESQDPSDANRTIYEVYVVDPDTNEMSEKPLDLPESVLQRIRLSMS